MDIKCREIIDRHSCRAFDKNKTIPEDIINKILKAASLAPSGRNLQPWRFRVISDENAIVKLLEFMPMNKWIVTANCLIVVYLDLNSSYHTIKDAMSIGAAMQNMLLEAEANGISSCWIGECVDNEDIDRILLPDSSFKLMAIAAFGYERMKGRRATRKEIKELLL